MPECKDTCQFKLYTNIILNSKLPHSQVFEQNCLLSWGRCIDLLID